MENLGDRLKTARLLRHLSQAELGRLCGLSQSAISSYERGTRKAPRELPRLAQVLGADVFWLSRGDGQMWASEAQTPALARESSWPFSRIDSQRYWALSVDARQAVEAVVTALVDHFEATKRG